MAQYYAYRVQGGHRFPLTPGGKRIFGPIALAWLRRRAKRHGYRMIVGTVHTPRDRAVGWLRWALSVEPRVHYAQIRPIPYKRGKAHTLDLTSDCSGTCGISAYVGGFRDPNGLGYNGAGYTGTLRSHLPRRSSPGACQPGDIIIYGPGNGEHACAVLEPGVDPLMFSHGCEADPKAYRHSQIAAAVGGGVFTCHDVSGG